MATNPTYVRLVSQADIPVTRIGVSAATSAIEPHGAGGYS
jgi:hypothetical protein